MRFLLNAVSSSTRAIQSARVPCVLHQNVAMSCPSAMQIFDKQHNVLPPPKLVTQRITERVNISSSQSNGKDSQPSTLMWGQQCSLNCGCVLRFETHVDPKTDKIISSTYTAKTVVTTVNSSDNTRTPVFTTSRGPKSPRKIMIKPCTCTTLHKLSQKITQFATRQKMYQLRNMTEYESIRSSPSFRAVVLRKSDLPRSDTSCFDLVEETLLAMVRGFMPAPRIMEIKTKKRRKRIRKLSEDFEKNSPLTMEMLRGIVMDETAGRWNLDKADHAGRRKKGAQRMEEEDDWLSYVDEQKGV